MREQETEAAPNQKIAVIRQEYFEAKYTDRFTPNSVIGKLFPELTEEVN